MSERVTFGFAVASPVEAQVSELLACAAGEFETGIAEKSPLGPRALRIRPLGVDGHAAESCRQLGGWLEAQWWVEAVTARGHNVYLRVQTAALRTWVAASFAAGVPRVSHPEPRRPVVVQYPEPRDAPCPLELAREHIAGRSLAALLAWSGFDVTAELAAAPTGVIVIDAVRVRVGGIDLPHGPLRTRLGASVSAHDLVREIRRSLPTWCPYTTWTWSDTDARALMAFVLLRTELGHHVLLDDARLGTEAAAFVSVLSALHRDEPLSAPTAPDGGDRVVRELAIELDLFPRVALRATEQLEPAFLTRYLRALAARLQGAGAYLAPGDPLRRVAEVAIDETLALLAVTVDGRNRKLTSIQVKGDADDHVTT